MKRTIVMLFLLKAMLFSNYSIHAQTPDFVWVERAGGTDNDRGNDIAVDGTGNSLVVGFFRGSADFDGTTFTSVSARDVFVAQYDPNGSLVWLRHAGGVATGGANSGANTGIGIATDASNNVIATGAYIGSITFGSTVLPIGGANEELFLVKYDSNGNMLWAKAATGSFGVFGFEVATDDAKNIYVTGTFGHHNSGGNVTFDSITLTSVGGGDAFVAKYDPNGNVLWAKRAGSSVTNNTDVGTDISTDGLGNSVTVGTFQGTADFGSITLNSAGSRDLFVAKYDANGNILWAKRAGGTADDRGSGIAMDNAGNNIITGWFSGSITSGSTTLTSLGGTDILISAYDAGGNVLWAKRAGGSQSGLDTDVGSEVDIDGSGNSVITGHFTGTADFGSTTLTSNGTEDIFVTKCDASGNFLSAKRAGGSETAPDTDRGAGIALDGSDNALVAGYFSGTADFDAETRTSAGGREIFIAKLGPSNQPPDCSFAAIPNQSAGANCQATISGSDVTGVTDPDGDPLTITVSPTSLVLGANTVTVSVDDGNGGMCSIDITVNVVDDTAPAPDVATLADATGECSVTLTAPTATDNCAGSITATTTDPTTYTAQGTFTVTWVYDDGNGNTSQQTQNVIVDDVTPPTITCPGDITVDEDALGSGNAMVNFAVTTSDNCSASVVNTPASGSLFPIGVTPVNSTATDAGGNQVSCSFMVTVLPALEHSFLLLADKKIDVSADSLMMGLSSSYGDIHANDKIHFHKGNMNTHTGNLTAVGGITIDKDNIIDGDVTAGGKLKIKSGATVTGTALGNTPVASEPLPGLSFTAGGEKVTVEEDQSQSLAPGSYGKIEVKKRGTLELSSGDYFFKELDLKDETTLSIDVSDGPVTINTVKKLHFHKNSQVTITSPAGHESRFVTFNSMKNVDVHEGARVLGSIIASEDKVHLHKDVTFQGAICAKDIDIDKGSTILHHDSSIPLPLAKVSSSAEDAEEDDQRQTLEVTPIPKEFGIEQNHPNPFNPSTTISFDIPETSEVKLAIYNMRGQLIQTLHSGVIAAGRHSVVWNGTDFRGVKVASGVYLYRLEAKGFVLSRKLAFMK